MQLMSCIEVSKKNVCALLHAHFEHRIPAALHASKKCFSSF